MNNSIYSYEYYVKDWKDTELIEKLKSYLLARNYKGAEKLIDEKTGKSVKVKERKFYVYVVEDKIYVVVDTDECDDKQLIDSAIGSGSIYACDCKSACPVDELMKEIKETIEIDEIVNSGFYISEDEIKKLKKDYKNKIQEYARLHPDLVDTN